MGSYKFIVSGHVQGVYYRKSVRKNAYDAGFCGYVKNLDDGTVEACVTCTSKKLDEFLSILRGGSTSSMVNEIKKLPTNEIYKKNFEIKYQ